MNLIIIFVVVFLVIFFSFRVVKKENERQKAIESVEHEWKFKYRGYDSKNHKEYSLYQCTACFDYKREFTGNVYQKKSEKHSCNFCESPETTEYPTEGKGTVWLCEDCKSIGSGESADR